MKLPEGTYWSVVEGRYVFPHEIDTWRPEEYERVTGQKLPSCSCGADGVYILFMSAFQVGDVAGRSDVKVYCQSCAEGFGVAAKQLGLGD